MDLSLHGDPLAEAALPTLASLLLSCSSSPYGMPFGVTRHVNGRNELSASRGTLTRPIEHVVSPASGPPWRGVFAPIPLPESGRWHGLEFAPPSTLPANEMARAQARPAAISSVWKNGVMDRSAGAFYAAWAADLVDVQWPAKLRPAKPISIVAQVEAPRQNSDALRVEENDTCVKALRPVVVTY
jgi:hypothetical protein